MKQHDLIHPQGKLGIDLPDKEEELFAMEQYPLFDMELAIDILGTRELVLAVLSSWDKDITLDIQAMHRAHSQGNWQEIEKLAHKLKSGALFGTVRLYFALLFMERYLKAGHLRSQNALYAQMIKIFDETLNELKKNHIFH